MRLIPLVLLSALLCRAQAAELDPATLIGKLARPAPASVAFTEVRISPLLRAPLIVSGELGYGGPANLDRHVTRPYREHTAIRGGSVRDERVGEPVRTFALNRAPQLRTLLTSFAALLAGDARSIERDFAFALAGDHDSWTLQLMPRDARARGRLRQIDVTRDIFLL